jgi:hypothetical protein
LSDYERSVFINCPFDDDFAPLLEAMLFCVVRAGLCPRLASERLEAGENRLDKIFSIIEECKYSIHDLSRAVAKEEGEALRMNMPFELGLDFGRRRAPDRKTSDKKFIIFEDKPYELKRSLSDLNGVDVDAHHCDFQNVIKHVRDFLTVEAACQLPGKSALEASYHDFQAWMIEKKISEGHTEDEAMSLPTKERLNEMQAWVVDGMPAEFLKA